MYCAHTQFYKLHFLFVQVAYTAEYPFDGSIRPEEDKNQLIDPNHSLFILVDDKKEGQFGGEGEWRREFEKYLSRSGTSNLPVPVVSIMLNGGITAIQAYSNKLPPSTKAKENGDVEERKTSPSETEPAKLDPKNISEPLMTPLIVIKGSGRAADMIAEMCYM